MNKNAIIFQSKNNSLTRSVHVNAMNPLLAFSECCIFNRKRWKKDLVCISTEHGGDKTVSFAFDPCAYVCKNDWTSISVSSQKLFPKELYCLFYKINWLSSADIQVYTVSTARAMRFWSFIWRQTKKNSLLCRCRSRCSYRLK